MQSYHFNPTASKKSQYTMSDSEEEPYQRGRGSDFSYDGPSTSWGAGRKSGGLKRKRKVLSDSEDEDEGPHGGGSGAEESEDDDEDAAGGDPLEGFTHTSSQLMQSMGIVSDDKVHGCNFCLTRPPKK